MEQNDSGMRENHMKMNNLASIKIWNKSFYIGAVLNFLDTVVGRHTNHDFGRYNRLRYVVGEVLKGRIENAYPGGEGMIEVELNLADDLFEVAIKDMGVPAWIDFSSNENPNVKDKEGLRNYLLEQWVDGIGMEKLGKNGQRIYIRMKIINPIQFKVPEPYPETEALDTNITIRPVQTEEDAIEAIRCIYSEYGYSYSYERLYYVESLLKLIKKGEIMSFLAVNDHGQTAGHFALVFSDTFKNMPEISTVVIRKEFRGLGLFGRFMDYSMELGKKQGLRALMGQPVAFHPMSQKAFLRSGFTATSVLLAYIGADIESEYNKDNQRLDLFASVKILDPEAKSVIYPPKELKPFIRDIYDRLGWSYELREEAVTKEHTEIRIEDSSSMKITKILLKEASEDLEQILNDTVKQAIRGKHDMIEFFISLRDPSCEYGYETAKKCGFVFSGLLPGGENDDYLVMQMLIGTDARYDHLVTVGEFEDVRNAAAALNHKSGEVE